MRFGLLLAIYLLFGCGPSQQAELHSGKRVDLKSLAGQVLVINYWAEWCGPCKEEIPELNQLDKHPRVSVLGVDFDGHQGAQLQQLVQQMGIGFGVIAKPAELERIHPRLPQQPPTLPTTYLLDLRRQPATLGAPLQGPQTELELLGLINAAGQN
ncbi:MAG: TlpA family protein disulfide reductase [Cellvibrionaceae bacterium]|nr:TlpA family protein disulfide reductase [Cellvibrionaceae bacterium]